MRLNEGGKARTNAEGSGATGSAFREWWLIVDKRRNQVANERMDAGSLERCTRKLVEWRES